MDFIVVGGMPAMDASFSDLVEQLDALVAEMRSRWQNGSPCS
jgi:hypothetical protein